MRNYAFLFRTKAADDRDCCAYVRIDDLKDKINYTTIHGACYSQRLKEEYSEVDTILTENQYNRLLCRSSDDDLTDIIEALTSDEAENFFNGIIESEIEYIKDEYNLTDDEIEEIFNNYSLAYRDRGIISYVYSDYYDLAENYIDSCCDVPEWIRNYIDYETFGKDVAEDERFIELESGWIVELNY